MKILLINKFLYPKGGDAISTLATGKLLQQKGHKVYFWGMKHSLNNEYEYSDYYVDNIDYDSLTVKEKINNSIKILYSFEAKKKFENFIKLIKPDIVHLNNFAHQISPSILHILNKYNIPTVMTLHDCKLICPSSGMVSNGIICEKCKNNKFYWCFLKKCKKNSYIKSLINAIEMYFHHKILKCYNLVDIYISPSNFHKLKHNEFNFHKKIIHLPNFVYLEDYIPSYKFDNEICYFGRLSQVKGINTLIDAVKELKITLKLIGEGPLKNNLHIKLKKENITNVHLLDYKKGDDLKNEVKKAMAVILPSECYENNPRSIIEAFALGKPVIGSNVAGIPELLKNGVTGYTFELGNVEDLRDKIKLILNNQEKIIEMGKNARKFVEKNFNPEKHYKKLSQIYEFAKEKKPYNHNNKS